MQTAAEWSCLSAGACTANVGSNATTYAVRLDVPRFLLLKMAHLMFGRSHQFAEFKLRPYETIQELRDAFSRHGVSIIYVKELAPNQDNDKNQIYLGKGHNAVTNVLPAEYSVRAKSASRRKRYSDPTKAIIEGRLQFSWLDRAGNLHRAPQAKLIEYFQYPEVRLSGFLQGCSWAPLALRREKQDAFGKRILLFGVSPDVGVVGLVVTEAEDPIVLNWPILPVFPAAPLLASISISAKPIIRSAVDLLCDELRTIFSAGWHEGRRLRPDGTIVPFKANQVGGYTLEALLGVPSNSDKKPDKHGHEVKAFSRSTISIMTPAPDGGEQGRLPFVRFMDQFGWPSKTKSDGTIVFNGKHIVGRTNPSTNATLVIDGYDPKTHTVTDAINCRIALRRGTVDLATWSLAHLASSWSKKHAAAVYVPFVIEKAAEGSTLKRMKYGPYFWLTSGTDVMMLIKAVSLGLVFYDPGDEITGSGKPWNRPQWRIYRSQLEKTMPVLYRTSQRVTF